MKPVLIHTHLGLGDHICTNAIVLHYADVYGKVYLACKSFNLDNVLRLYRGEPRVIPVAIPLGQREEEGEYEMVNRMVANVNGSLIRVGHNPPYRHDDQVSPDEKFYNEVGLDYERRFDGFRLLRDAEAEERAYFNLVGSRDEPYAFVQSDPQWPLRPEWGGLRPMFNSHSIPFFDLGLILERATELHLPNSAIRCLVDSRSVYDMSKPRLFFHDLRAPIWGDSTRLEWTMVNYD